MNNNKIWGPPAWTFLHTITFNYPENPTNREKHNYFNFQIIQQLKDEHFKGISNHEHKLWSLIQFNNWYLTHID